MYKINDYLIYKREVCQVKALTKINNQDYYILENKADSSLKISVPLKEERNLLRPLSTFKEITKSLDNIDNIKPLNLTDRNLEEQYKSLLQGNTLEDLIVIMKTTYLRNEVRKSNKKHLGDKDTYYQELSEKFLFNEVAYSMQISYDDAKELVLNKLASSVYKKEI